MFISVLNLFFAAVIVFLERRNVVVTWAWIMVLLFLPGVGFVLYLILGQNLSRRKLYKMKEEKRGRFHALIEAQRERFRESRINFHDPQMAYYKDMMFMNLTSGNAFYTQDNNLDIFPDGLSKFDALLEDIGKAEHHIHLMYFIVRNDLIGRKIVDALACRAREGVKVRFLYDHIGCSSLPKGFFDQLIASGGHVAAFFPSKLRYINFRVNYRNHRKLAIIDGRYGYIGGLNIGDEYMGLVPRFGYWRDTHLRLQGSAVLQMQAQFMMDWNLAAPYRAFYEDEKYYPHHSYNGKIGAQIVASGPDEELEQIKNGYIKMILAAKESIYIQTPYFIPDDSLLTALRMAAFAGVDIRFMIPSKPDHKMVYWATYSYLHDLLEAGIKCYLYERGFLHAKTIVVDGKVASVGTANVDIRSFKLNFEVNAFIYDTAAAHRLQRIFEADQENCRELTLEAYRKRPLLHRIEESFARLLSPIL
ncbi:cardiolipin synthase [Paenibacillus tarimensis]|uniref:cardiolipin synthase n=1 Tax=Paenibacillus tarimensis TaxID=416012 RepID=UPI001F2E1E22|nr:cardiolipin synthase [Paenibacillus tarimensis]MCF2944829.1 cardiolipin synthase [Paenibacillus tarimensis]